MPRTLAPDAGQDIGPDTGARPAPDGRILTFTLGEKRMGLAADAVREVITLPSLTRVPHMADALLGVANVRGLIVPVLSAARLLGRAPHDERRVIVTELDGPLGLAVSTVSQMVDGQETGAVERIDVAALVARAVPERRGRRASPAIMPATQTEDETSQAIALLAFAVGGQDFALPLAAVEEVLLVPQAITRLPHAESAVLGGVASRGAVLPLLSLAALLALPAASPTRRARVIVVRIGHHRVGLLVEAMRTIERVTEHDIDPVPAALNRGAEARIQAICRLGGDRLLSVLAPEQLLSEEITARLQQGETGDRRTMTGSSDEERGERFLLFRIGAERFGLPIDAVREVALLPERLTPLPKAPAFVRGVMNLRGEVIPVIDQGRRFHGVPVAAEKPRVIVVQVGTLTAGFIVESVSQVAWVPERATRAAPDLGSDETRVFDRIVSLDGEEALVLIVSPQDLLDRAERDLLAELGKKAAKAPT